VKPYRARYTQEAAGRIRKLHPQIKREVRDGIRALLDAPLAGHALQFDPARIIHERFCCKRGYAVPTGVLAAQSVSILFQVCLPPSRLCLPVSQRVYAFSPRPVMNNAG